MCYQKIEEKGGGGDEVKGERRKEPLKTNSEGGTRRKKGIFQTRNIKRGESEDSRGRRGGGEENEGGSTEGTGTGTGLVNGEWNEEGNRGWE